MVKVGRITAWSNILHSDVRQSLRTTALDIWPISVQWLSPMALARRGP